MQLGSGQVSLVVTWLSCTPRATERDPGPFTHMGRRDSVPPEASPVLEDLGETCSLPLRGKRGPSGNPSELFWKLRRLGVTHLARSLRSNRPSLFLSKIFIWNAGGEAAVRNR